MGPKSRVLSDACLSVLVSRIGQFLSTLYMSTSA
jgi:hypothetical protein